MKKIFLFLIFSCFLISCRLSTPYSVQYSMIKPIEKQTPIAYKDDKIDILFNIEKDGISFTLNNISNLPLKINWDEMSIVLDGKANRLMHKGVAYMDRSKSQVISVVPPNTTLEDIVIPTMNIHFVNTKNAFWDISPLYKISMKNVSEMKGKKLSLYFPMIFNDEKIDYNFEFQIDKVFIKGKEIK